MYMIVLYLSAAVITSLYCLRLPITCIVTTFLVNKQMKITWPEMLKVQDRLVLSAAYIHWWIKGKEEEEGEQMCVRIITKS